MREEKKALVFFRKSKFHPDPVICCVVEVHDENWALARERCLRWKDNFIRRFPEFTKAEFYSEEAEII